MRRILFSVALVFGVALSGFAQDVARFEIYGGAAFLRDPRNFNRYGWVTSFTGNVNEWFGVKGEVAGVYNDGDNVHSYLGGPQFTLRRSSRLEPWAHFLVGAQHNAPPVFTIQIFPPPSIPRTFFAIEPGGGVDVSLNHRISLRFGADYVRTIRELRDVGHYRAHSGIVFKLP